MKRYQNQKVVVESGNSFLTLLLILFIGLKLGKVIAWSWLWVLSPIWIPLAAAVVIFVLYLIVKGLKALTK